MKPKKRKTEAPVKAKKEIPYKFVLEQLENLNPYTKPMFGCTAIYVDEKIVFIVRKKTEAIEDNGLWLATFPEHHESLRQRLTTMRSIGIFGPGPTSWQVLPAESDRFEEEALRACELVVKKDPRIGKVPARKRPKTKKKKRA